MTNRIEIAEEIAAFLDSIEGAGYGGMASYEIARKYAHELICEIAKLVDDDRRNRDRIAELRNAPSYSAGYAAGWEAAQEAAALAARRAVDLGYIYHIEDAIRILEPPEGKWLTFPT